MNESSFPDDFWQIEGRAIFWLCKTADGELADDLEKEYKQYKTTQIHFIMELVRTPGQTSSCKIAHQWFAIYTKPKFEKKLNKAFQKANIQSFLPLVEEKRIWSDRLKTVIVPLLPSYIFVRIQREQISRLYAFPGVVRLVCSGGRPCVIKDNEIEFLRQVEAHKHPIEKVCSYVKGDMVHVIRGPLKGYQGRISVIQGVSKLVFEIEGIKMGFSVEVCSGDVAKV